jgi:hypothetical protein
MINGYRSTENICKDLYSKMSPGKKTNKTVKIYLIYRIPERIREEVVDNIGKYDRKAQELKNQINEGSFKNVKCELSIKGSGRSDRNTEYYTEYDGEWKAINEVYELKNVLILETLGRQYRAQSKVGDS